MDGTTQNNGFASATQDDGVPAKIDLIDTLGVMEAIPHRYPFLMIDRVIDLKRHESCIGIKNVSVNESYFQGHFSKNPVMPGVLIIECMAQTAAVMVVKSLGPEAYGKLVYFMSVERAKFRRPVTPGDQLHIHVTEDRNRGNVYRFGGIARVDGVVVAEALFSAMIRDERDE